MRILLIVVLAANALFEGLVGLLLIIAPESAVSDGSEAGISFATNYGFAALTIASISAWCWRDKDKLRTMGVVLGILATFHSGLTIAMVMNMSAATGAVPAVAHGILALLFWFLWFNRGKWCSA